MIGSAPLRGSFKNEVTSSFDQSSNAKCVLTHMCTTLYLRMSHNELYLKHLHKCDTFISSCPMPHQFVGGCDMWQ